MTINTMAQKKKNWYDNPFVAPIIGLAAAKLFGPLEAIIGFISYGILVTKYKKDNKTALLISLGITLVCTIIAGMWINSVK